MNRAKFGFTVSMIGCHAMYLEIKYDEYSQNSMMSVEVLVLVIHYPFINNSNSDK